MVGLYVELENSLVATVLVTLWLQLMEWLLCGRQSLYIR